MGVLASDQSNPEKTAFIDAFITVNRDQFLPRFQNEPYEVTIQEIENQGSSIYRVTATDFDLVVSRSCDVSCGVHVTSIFRLWSLGFIKTKLYNELCMCFVLCLVQLWMFEMKTINNIIWFLNDKYFIFQGQIQYDLIGDYPTESFFSINNDNGNIFTLTSLKTDSLRSNSYVVSHEIETLH